jgi:NAD(P)-dependent dehydrogenase (short-subunit alcohol dehydrogenase family)
MDTLEVSGRKTMTDNKYRILVTGASSGFGKLTAITLARAGYRVFAGMRDPQGKNAAAKDELVAQGNGHGGSVDVVDLDVTSDASVDAAVASMASKLGGIDVVVNNAGVSATGISEAFTVDQTRALYEVNVFGVQRVNRAVLPIMRRGNGGLLVHVSSSIGRIVMPLFSVYISSKFALEALAEGYRYELAPSGIESVLVEPGAFPTKLVANMLFPADKDRAAAYPALQPVLNGLMGMLEAQASGPNAPNPQDVADAISRLVAMAPGTRPIRTSVDGQMGPVVEGINRFLEQVQAQALGAMGMSALLTPNVSRKD